MTNDASFQRRRRRFLQASAGAVCMAGASVVPALEAVRPLSMGTKTTLRLGVLLPESKNYPHLADDFLMGLKAGFAPWPDMDLQWHPLRYGQRGQQALEAVQTALTTDTFDALTGFACCNTLAQCAHELQARQVPLLVCDAGANAMPSSAQSPWVLRNSLGHWQTAWQAGVWAAQHVGHKALIALPPQDSGFDLAAAFTQGFESQQGRVQGVVLTHQAHGVPCFDQLTRAIQEHKPDVVYVTAAGTQAQEFAAAWSQATWASQTQWVLGGMLAEHVLTHGPRPTRTRAWGVWSRDPNAPAAADVSVFYGLGHEAALRLATTAVHACDPVGWTHAMRSAVVASLVRGPVGMNIQGETVITAHVKALHHRHAASSPLDAPMAAALCDQVCASLRSRVTDTYLLV
jgi:hypothetical protein